MPMVSIDWLEGRTPEQKAQLAHALTQAFVQIAHVPPEQVWIVFRDARRSDWSMGGRLVSEAPR